MTTLREYWAFLDSPRCQCKRRLAHNCLGPPECNRPPAPGTAHPDIDELHRQLRELRDITLAALGIPRFAAWLTRKLVRRSE